MSVPIVHFLLVFDHQQSRLVHSEEFGTDVNSAVEAYGRWERTHQDDRNLDIVLVGSDSLETVELTHANYFDGTAAAHKWQSSEYLAGLTG
jgi:hypothetical protein